MIKIDSLSKKFGNFTAVDNLTFDIRQHEIFGLLGPNGAGKTTTINMICGLLPSFSGSIHFDNQRGNDWKSLIGYCPQENIFYPKLTCVEQLVFIGQLYGMTTENAKKRALELLNLLGLEDKKSALASDLSGGMKRRLNICLALIHNPEILILDEPEAGLDPQSRILVRDFIRDFGRQKTILLTTHNMDEADRLADRVAIIDYGKLLLLDTPQNLKKTVGDGDVLEVYIDKCSQSMLNQFVSILRSMSLKVRLLSESILIKHTNIIDQVSVIKSLAEKEGLLISEIKLRENTLEDVFIHLTGRNLRQ